jgi:hypothetical protein
MSIIALSGKSGSGKDAFAKFACERGYERLAFADPLKEAVQGMYGFTREQLWGELKNVVDPYWGITPRKACQDLGTIMRNAAGLDFWIRALVKRMDPAKNYVVTDMRYQNEAEAMALTGARLVRIERPNNPSGLKGEAAAHPSETELDEWTRWDRIVVNCRDLSHLWAMAVGTADEFRDKPFVPREPAHRFPQWKGPLISVGTSTNVRNKK